MFNKAKSIIKKRGIFLTVMCVLISIWTGCGDEAVKQHVGRTMNSASSVKDSITDESGTAEIYDEAVSVVGSFLKAELSRSMETAQSYCTDSLKDEVRDDIEETKAQIKSSYSGQMDTFISAAQVIFSSAGNYIDTINAEYLYDDSDMQKACEELTESMYRSTRIYSLPEKAELISDKDAVVVVNFTSKNITEAEYSLSDDIMGYLESIVLDKLMENSNFIKEQIAKKIVKEVLIDQIKDWKNKIEETTDEIPIRKKTYHLTNENGNWLISKINIEDFSGNYYGEVSEEGDYDEDENREEQYLDMYDNFEDDYYENEEEEQYILPYSNSEYLDESDLENLSAEECRIARNEIYARHGRIFEDEKLNAYFNSKDWYEGNIRGEDFVDDVFNDYETQNLITITEYEKMMGY